jgi:hypothetical protein
MMQHVRSTIPLLLMIAHSGCGGCDRDKVTLKNFDRIEVGMTRKQVESFMGKPSDSGMNDRAPVGPEQVCLWKDKDKTKAIVVFYVDDKVVRKGKKGLDDKPATTD